MCPGPALTQTSWSPGFLQALLGGTPVPAALMTPERPDTAAFVYVTILDLELNRHGFQSWPYHQLAL